MSQSDTLLVPLHVSYIQKLGESQDDLMYHLTSHLRLNAVYWGLTALCVMKHKDALDREQLLDFVMSCWDEKAGAFGAHPRHDAHILPTLSAIQILVMHNAIERLDRERVISYVMSRQSPSGSFSGDRFGETDTRFCYCAVSALSLLGALDRLDKEKTVEYIQRCKNFDGGFGNDVGGESHASQVFSTPSYSRVPSSAALSRKPFLNISCSLNPNQRLTTFKTLGTAWTCVGTLAILDRLDAVDSDTLSWWLSERQLPNGGLNGRPEKLEDVCYSFWVLSTLSILNKMTWIDSTALERFILSAQDAEAGGIADRPGDMADVWHTVFGVAGLSLLGYPGLEDLDPVYCMPRDVIERMGLKKGWVALPRRV